MQVLELELAGKSRKTTFLQRNQIFVGHSIIVVTHGEIMRMFFATCLRCHKEEWENAKAVIVIWKNGIWIKEDE